MKILAGNPGRRPLNDQEPQFECEAPEKPKGMAPAASREWDRIVVLLLSRHVITNVDGKALAAYCDAYAMWEMARKDLLKNGLVHETPILDKFQQPIFVDDKLLIKRQTNPAFTVYNNAAKLMKAFLIEFGLTPASRSKLKIQPPKEEDPMEDLLNQRPGLNKVEGEGYFDTGTVKLDNGVEAEIKSEDIGFDA